MQKFIKYQITGAVEINKSINYLHMFYKKGKLENLSNIHKTPIPK